MPDRKIHTLSQVILYIKGVIDAGLAKKHFWLKAELSNINFHRTGHCYIDLVENENGRTLAQCRANIWSGQLNAIREDLGADFDNVLKKGAEILFIGEVVFDPVYGLSINISKVDKTFALGELERKKQETLQRLTDMELLDKNKQHSLPTVIQKIAVVGSVGTSGHTDFLKQLDGNEHGFDFEIRTYSCAVQGDHAAPEIIGRLDSLTGSDVDAIVLIRGGGSKLDLEVFNTYELAYTIAQHPKPILTGIGHETDISVADIVANQYFKTPSALGSFIVDRAYRFYVQVNSTYSYIHEFYDKFMQRQQHRIVQISHGLRSEAIGYTRLRRGELHTVANRINAQATGTMADQREFHQYGKEVITSRSRQLLENHKNRLKSDWTLAAMRLKQQFEDERRQQLFSVDLLRTYVRHMLQRDKAELTKTARLFELYHPLRTLERGYAIVRKDGHVVDSSTVLAEGDELEIELKDKILITTYYKEEKKWTDSLTKALQKS